MIPNSIITKKPLKIAVAGSRSCTDAFLVFEYLAIFSTSWEVEERPNEITLEIVSGGAKGPDTFAEKFALINQIPTKIFLPDWDKHGKSAGFIRNKQIVDYSDMVIAFWDRKSKGTKSTIDLAIKQGKPVYIIPTE